MIDNGTSLIEARVGELVEVKVEATDPEDDSISFSLLQFIDGASIDQGKVPHSSLLQPLSIAVLAAGQNGKREITQSEESLNHGNSQIVRQDASWDCVPIYTLSKTGFICLPQNKMEPNIYGGCPTVLDLTLLRTVLFD